MLWLLMLLLLHVALSISAKGALAHTCTMYCLCVKDGGGGAQTRRTRGWRWREVIHMGQKSGGIGNRSYFSNNDQIRAQHQHCEIWLLSQASSCYTPTCTCAGFQNFPTTFSRNIALSSHSLEAGRGLGYVCVCVVNLDLQSISNDDETSKKFPRPKCIVCVHVKA